MRKEAADKFSEKSSMLNNMRAKMNLGSMHSSIGTSKKNLSEVEGNSAAMQSGDKSRLS